MGKSPRAV